MTIVCLGWGSLIWDPGTLPVLGAWHNDGPLLPLEFARESRDGRMTLVIVEQGAPVPVLWAALDVADIEAAAQALAEREGVEWLGAIGRWPADRRAHRHSNNIGTWARQRGHDGVVWTDLKAGFRPTRSVVPSLEEVSRYLAGLTDETRENAARYVFKAPAQIATPYRASIERLLAEHG